jgi:prepilin-type N-terminal cleavage/methylation domain-containing protein
VLGDPAPTRLRPSSDFPKGDGRLRGVGLATRSGKPVTIEQIDMLTTASPARDTGRRFSIVVSAGEPVHTGTVRSGPPAARGPLEVPVYAYVIEDQEGAAAEAEKCDGKPQGFLLIELLVVIAIIAIQRPFLPRLLPRQKPGARRPVANLRRVVIALQMYMQDDDLCAWRPCSTRPPCPRRADTSSSALPQRRHPAVPVTEGR